MVVYFNLVGCGNCCVGGYRDYIGGSIVGNSIILSVLFVFYYVFIVV